MNISSLGISRLLLSLCIFILLLPDIALAQKKEPVNKDFELWEVTRFTTPISAEDKWHFAFQAEFRLGDDINNISQYIIKPYGHIKFSEKLGLSLGLKYIHRPAISDEKDIWQEVAFPRSYKKFNLTHQVRLEQRFYDGIDGIIPRIRYLLNFSVPLSNPKFYITGFGAVRFNLTDEGEGPVEGFEQVRINASFGVHHSKRTRIEIGYLYRYEESRGTASDLSDNAIHLQIMFNGKDRIELRSTPEDSYL